MATFEFDDDAALRSPENSAFNRRASLLTGEGPKQTRKPKATEEAEATPKPTTFDPRALLNPASARGGSSSKPTDSNDDKVEGISSTLAPESSNENGNEVGGGMSKFLGGVYNTTEREVPLQRKRQHEQNGDADEDEEHKKSKGFHDVAGGGGIIGNHLKDERKKQAQEAGPPDSAPIDLTGDDGGDDDLTVTGFAKKVPDSGAEHICLGVLKTRANAFKIPATQQILGKEFWPRMKVGMKRAMNTKDNIIELTDRNKHAFARLEITAASALVPLMDGAHVSQLRMKTFLDARRRKPEEVAGAPTSQSMPVLITLYSPRNKAEQIGKRLSQKQLYLETPKVVDMGVEVANPHLPKDHNPNKLSTSRPTTVGSIAYTQRTVEEMRRDATTMFDNLRKNEDLPEKEVNGEIISTPLMSHQKQALHFLTDHENHDTLEGGDTELKFSLWKPTVRGNGKTVWYNVITGHEVSEPPAPVYGGILADVMGLGKTLSILSLVAATVEEANKFRTKRPSSDLEGVERNAKGTLIVCPKSVLSNWSEQIAAHVKPGKLMVYVYHGISREQDLGKLAQYDIVLTSYGTAANEIGDSLKKKRALSSLQWFRIVLDEAHSIRNAGTHISKGACALTAQRRWAVTGTPVQNRLDDLGALIRFLRIKPFDESQNWAQYIVSPFKNANADVLQHLRLLVDGITLRRGKNNIGLTNRVERTIKLQFSDDEKRLYARFASQSNMQLKGMLRDSTALRGKTYAHVLKSLLRLRRICDHGREMLNEDDLADLEGMDASNAIDLGDEPELEEKRAFISERQAYELLHVQDQNDMDMCSRCNKTVAPKKDKQTDDEDSDSASEDEGDEPSDIIGYLTPCYHLFCAKCKEIMVREVQPPELRPDGYSPCRVCEAYTRFEFFDLTRAGYQAYVDEHVNGNKKVRRATWNPDNYSGPHTKVHALLEELDKSAAETAAHPNPDDPPIRSVVFTEWTSYLDLVEFALEDRNIGYVRLDGKMNVKQRSQVLHTFKTDPTITVLLVSIRAGGQGLNFTAANKVYMMEPQFNPGVEQQAIDRVHRLGQNRDVEITHFIMAESVEEALVKLQDKKMKLARLSMEKKRSRPEEAKRKIDELRELFK